MSEQGPEKNPELIDKIKEKAIPVMVAGVVGALSGNPMGAAAGETGKQILEENPNVQIQNEVSPSASEKSLTPENYKIVNDSFKIIDDAISEFKFLNMSSTETLSKEADEAISEMDSCLMSISGIKDKSVSGFCTGKILEVRKIMNKYKESEFEHSKDMYLLNQLEIVKGVLKDYVDRFNSAYENQDGGK